MSYCEIGQKAVVTFKFSDRPQDTFTTDSSPIDVTATHEGAGFTGGQCEGLWYGVVYTTPEGQIRRTKDVGVGVRGAISSLELFYEDRYGDPNYIFNYAWVALVGGTGGDDARLYRPYYPEADPNDPKSQIGLYYIFLNYAAYGRPAIVGLERYNPNGEDISLEDNCGDPPDTLCHIRVSSNDNLLMSQSGKPPCYFSITCGEECPKGFLKCKSTNYPGYCCIPCNEIKAELIASRVALRMLKNG